MIAQASMTRLCLSTGRSFRVFQPVRCLSFSTARYHPLTDIANQGSGHAQGWGTAVECQDSACQGSVAAHSKSFPAPGASFKKKINRLMAEYKTTTIILDSADASFRDTLSLNEADSSDFSTSDNGKTWKVSNINIHSHTYNL